MEALKAIGGHKSNRSTAGYLHIYLFIIHVFYSRNLTKDTSAEDIKAELNI